MIPNPSVRESPRIKILNIDSGELSFSGAGTSVSIVGFEQPALHKIVQAMKVELSKSEFVILVTG
tara:strand:+ start:538 stop:732 length:195 start_codon:yes stop_codon:yes gene_type:complete